jgi:hypothetical protein
LASAAKTAFQAASLARLEGSGADLRLGIAAIQFNEKTSRNSSYSVNVVLDVQVIQRASSQLLWQTRKSGNAGNYGEAGLAANYQETLSRGIEDAFNALLSDGEFSKALCQAAGASAAPPPPQP